MVATMNPKVNSFTRRTRAPQSDRGMPQRAATPPSPHDVLQERKIARDLFSDTMTADASAHVVVRPSNRQGGGMGEKGDQSNRWVPPKPNGKVD